MLPCFLDVLPYGGLAPKYHQSLDSKGLEALYNCQKYVILRAVSGRY